MSLRQGILRGARFVPSPNADERPAGAVVSLVVLHAISLPPGRFGGDAVERLFTNRLQADAHPYYRGIAGLRVSSHFFVRRGGGLVQFVPVQLRAWHAGVSKWRSRGRCNDFSIGVELEGTDRTAFTAAQYAVLGNLIKLLRREWPLRDVAAHSDVAPGRKSDPGAGFDWHRILAALARR